MTQKFLLPRPQQVTAAGAPIVGSIAFYVTTTSTPLSVFSDRGLTIPLANPVNADANGRLPAIWFQNSDVFAGIKAVFYDGPNGTGSAIWSMDPYEDNTTAADLNAAQLAGGNAFTGDQSFANAVTFNGQTTLESTDAGATAGPTLELYRNSASPAAADDLGKIDFQGKDSAGNLENYARIKAVAVDPTSTAEDGKLAVHTVVAGAIAERMAVGAGVTVGSPTGGDPGAGKSNAVGVQVGGNPVAALIFRSTQTAAGTSIDEDTIPAGVRRITVILGGVSIDNTTELLLQIGDSGGIETSGYAGGAAYVTTGSSGGVNSTAGFLLSSGAVAATVHHVTAVLHLIDPATNTWSCSMSGGLSNGPTSVSGGGTKSLSGTLTQIRVTTVSGTAAFDAGTITVAYESYV